MRMKPLPKPEYNLLKDLIERFNLDGQQEAFKVLLILGWEVLHSQPDWLARIIGESRTTPKLADYRYPIPD